MPWLRDRVASGHGSGRGLRLRPIDCPGGFDRRAHTPHTLGVKSEHGAPPPSSEPFASSDILHPLDDFYARAGLEVPRFELVAAHEVPEPYKSLLVHEADMTPTLESFHGARLRVAVLSRQ